MYLYVVLGSPDLHDDVQSQYKEMVAFLMQLVCVLIGIVQFSI